MKTQLLKSLLLGIVACCTSLTSHAQDDNLSIKYLGNGQSFVRPVMSQKYLLLPIEEKAGESRVTLIVDNYAIHTMHIRLAVDKIDY